MSPSAINSPRRSRGLLIARGRMQLSFNLATGGAINGSHGPQRPICKFWCYVHAINLSIRLESSLNQFKSVPNCSEVLSGFGTGRFCAHRCFVTMSNAQKRQKRQAATNAEAAIAHQSSPRSYVPMSSLCADADADADACQCTCRCMLMPMPMHADADADADADAC